MWYRIAADAVVVLHLLFIGFVLLGGFAAVFRTWIAFVHIPCALWATAIELTGWICPLTPLEVFLRRHAGQAGYDGGFIEHYLIPVLYPPGLTRSVQVLLGAIVIGVNVVAYLWWWHRRYGGGSGGAAPAADEEPSP